jgi:hypothetical protein
MNNYEPEAPGPRPTRGMPLGALPPEPNGGQVM